MSEDEKLKNKTIKAYYDVLKTHAESEAQFTQKLALFERNLKKIQAHSNDNIKVHLANQTIALDNLKKDHESLDHNFAQHLKSHQVQKDKSLESLNTQIKEVEEAHEKKRTLKHLQEQKLDSDYEFKLKEIAQTRVQEIETLEKTVVQANKTYDKNMKQLSVETEQKLESLRKKFHDDNLEYTKNHEMIKSKVQEKIIENENKLSAYEHQLEEALTALEKAFKKAIDPIEKQMQAIEQKHQATLDKMTKAHQAIVDKKEKYRKEAEKINDMHKANVHLKEIRQHHKTHEEDLRQTNARFEVELEPILKSKQEVMLEYDNRSLALKQQGLDKITTYLNHIQVAKTEEMLETDELNHAFNLAHLMFEQNKESTRLDDTIQAANFKQNKEEQLLTTEYQQAIMLPKQDIEALHAKHHLDKEKNTITKAAEVAKANRDKAKALAHETYRHAIQKVDYETARLKALLTFDHEMLKLNHERLSVDQLVDLENMLVKHYFKQSQNYTALKTVHLVTHRPTIETEIKNRTKNNIKYYQTLIEQAEKDHQIMCQHIDDVYQLESQPYNTIIEKIKAEQNDALAALKAKQLEETQTMKTALKTQPKDRNEMRLHTKQLELLKEVHQEQLNHQEQHYKNTLKPYQQLLQHLQQTRVQSLEETETLLHHVTDQYQLLIDTALAQEKQVIQMVDTTQTNIQHSADLFQTFQYQRQEDTVDATQQFHQSRYNTLYRLQKESEKKRADQHAKLDRGFHTLTQQYNQKIQNIKDENYRQLEKIKQTSIDQLRKIEENYHEEIRRTELYISKLTRQHDNKMKELSREIDTIKQDCFSKKEASERYLEKETERLEEALIQERDRKDRLKKETIDNHKKRMLDLVIEIESDPMHVLMATQIRDLKDYILQRKTLIQLINP